MDKKRGKTRYSPLWEKEFTWLQPHPTDLFSAQCKVCRTFFDVASMGIQAVKSHHQGKKHQSRIQSSSSQNQLKLTDVQPAISGTADALKSSTEQSSSETREMPSTSKESSQITLQNLESSQTTSKMSSTFKNAPKGTMALNSYVIKNEVTRAEILWCLQAVVTHRSLRDTEQDCLVMKKMFGENEVAAQMKMSKDKIKYSVIYGLGHYFASTLVQKTKNVDHFVIGFDESLNQSAQAQQMDVVIRFWDETHNVVKSRYLTSVFLNRATAEDLYNGLSEALKEFDTSKILQVSMDGPNVNIKLLKLLKQNLRLKEDDPEFLEIGTCGIHVVHNAFKTGITRTGWLLHSFLRALYNYFKNVPSRRGEFTRITDCKDFPLKFCGIRWLENIKVVQRAVHILPAIKEYVKVVGKKPTKDQPQCESYSTIKHALEDKLLPAKLAFFESLATDVEPFLKEFQADAPLAPFLHASLSELLRNVIRRIITTEALNATDLKKLDINKKENLRPIKELELGYGVRKSFKDCKDVSPKDVLIFNEECRKCIIAFFDKICERSPLKYTLTKALACLNPETIRSDFEDTNNLQVALQVLVESNLMAPIIADKVLREYRLLLQETEVKDKMKTFFRDEARLDSFWMEIMDSRRHTNLVTFVKLILILSHGNASLERGFSINKECVVENQKHQSLIAQRHIFDAVCDLGGVENVQVTTPMIHAMRNASGRYKEALEEQRKKNTKEKEKEHSRREQELQIKELERRKRSMLENVDKIDDEIKRRKTGS